MNASVISISYSKIRENCILVTIFTMYNFSFIPLKLPKKPCRLRKNKVSNCVIIYS